MNGLSEDSIFGQVFGFLGKMIALNILWIVTSLPIVTIGASTTAMYYTALKLHKDDDVTVWKSLEVYKRQLPGCSEHSAIGG